jgi:hypothetical protein
MDKPSLEGLMALVTRYGNAKLAAVSNVEIESYFRLAKERDQAREAIRTYAERLCAPSASAAVPEGWKLVPVEPTPEMVKRAMKDCGGIGGGSCGEHVGAEPDDMREVWSSMLAAAPSAPVREPVAWMTDMPHTSPVVTEAFLRERPEYRIAYPIPLYAPEGMTSQQKEKQE